MPLSVAGLGIAAVVFIENRDASIPANLFATSFMTLSILTVPHMLLPRIAAFFQSQRRISRVGVASDTTILPTS